MPVAWGSIALALLLAAWLMHGKWSAQFARLKRTPAALFAIALLALYAIGTLYSTGSSHDTAEFLIRYAKLIIIPIVLMSIDDEKWRRRTVNAFLIGLGVELLVSYARRLGIISMYPDPNQRFIGLINHISYGVMLAFGAYVFAWRAMHAKEWNFFWGICALAATINILFINSGRTGYVIYFSLFALFFIQHWKWRGVMIGGITAAVLIAAALTLSPTARHRTEQIQQNIQQFSKGQDNTPVGLRLLHYREALNVIAHRPLIGYGTGSFAAEYEKAIAGTDNFIVSNPENEYLITLAQLGIIGLFILLSFLLLFWIETKNMPNEERHFAQALLIAFIVGSLFNSVLLDALEGRFFVLLAGIFLASSLTVARDSKKSGHACLAS